MNQRERGELLGLVRALKLVLVLVVLVVVVVGVASYVQSKQDAHNRTVSSLGG